MITEKIKSCVIKNDKESLYIILSDYLIEDFKKFDENIKYIQKYIDIFVKHDQKQLEEDKEKWNENYLFLEKGRLITNFSKERVEHIKNIIKKLYPEKNKEIPTSTTYSTGTNKKRKPTINKKKTSGDDIIPKIAVGTGAIIAGVGLLSLKISLIAMGAVVAVGGVVYKYNKEN